MKQNHAIRLIWSLVRNVGDTEMPAFWSGSGRRLRELAYGVDAENERGWRRTGDEWVEEFILLGLSPEQRPSWHVIEIGCGPGRMLGEMAKRFERVVGIDFSPDMVRHTRNRYRKHGNVQVLCNDGRTIPLPNSSVDLVYSVLALQHMGRGAIASYFSEANRVLKPGGLFRFQTRWDVERRNSNYMDRYFLSVSDVERFARSNRFEIIDYQRGLAHPLFHWFTLRRMA
jgi:SAM-dependent methyltransferase